MTWPKLILIAGLASLLSAGILALVSRTPASVRNDKPRAEATSAALGADFTDDQIARHGAYRGPTYLGFVLRVLLPLLALLLLARGPFRDLVDGTSNWRGGWPVQALLLGAAMAVLTTLLLLPLSFVQGYAIQHAWDLSTQSVGDWAVDQAKGMVIGAVIGAVAAVTFFAMVRGFPRTWWVWGWLAFTVLTALLVFLYPLVIAPWFNRFTPIEDPVLEDRIVALANDAGVDIGRVVVADASKRTTSENAYVAGLGSSKQMVLYDTLLDAGSERETLFVVGHELGHKKENHVVRGVVASSVGLFVGFGLLYLLSRNESLWSWGGASGVGDLRAIPLLLLYLAVMTVVLLPLESTLSRHHESQADAVAIDLTGDPDTAVATFRRLAFANLADLRPPAVAVWALFSHPPIPDRIGAVIGFPRSP
ncbi:MAG: M48 family metallopeptidase [Actinomycetota bacterium]